MIENRIERIAGARSLLFVPGTRPERFAKAVARGADEIVLDLEDSVAPDRKDEARENVIRWRAAGGAGLVRINGAESAWHDDDLAALADRPGTVMVPKVNSAGEVRAILAKLPDGSAVLPILESATGILEARTICAAPGVLRAALGNADLALDLGVNHTDQAALWYARSALVMASAAAQIAPPIDGVTTDYHDDEQLRADIRHGKGLGFGGKLCIHPRQVPLVNSGFDPTDDELDQARRIVEAAGDGAVAVLDGAMIDRPLVLRARRLLKDR